MKRILMFILLLGAAQLAAAADLTGTWQCDDGGTYYLRQAGSELHWYGETATTAPRWSNVFDGRISGSRIKGRWYDPREGTWSVIGEYTNRGIREFAPAGNRSEGRAAQNRTGRCFIFFRSIFRTPDLRREGLSVQASRESC